MGLREGEVEAGPEPCFREWGALEVRQEAGRTERAQNHPGGALRRQGDWQAGRIGKSGCWRDGGAYLGVGEFHRDLALGCSLPIHRISLWSTDSF